MVSTRSTTEEQLAKLAPDASHPGPTRKREAWPALVGAFDGLRIDVVGTSVRRTEAGEVPSLPRAGVEHRVMELPNLAIIARSRLIALASEHASHATQGQQQASLSPNSMAGADTQGSARQQVSHIRGGIECQQVEM